MKRFNFLRSKRSLFRKLFGFIFIVSMLFLAYIISTKPFYGKVNSTSLIATKLINPLEHPYKTPQIEGINAWINSQPLHLSKLKGKVILIDFWTSSCINCIRTLPYLKGWYAKYHDQGFEIIGIHSPEFEFEHKLDNVKHTVVQYGIKYPVALDSHFSTWLNFHNEYWPAQYLINQKGEVVYEHFGEGEYEVTENNIRYLLGLTEPNNVPSNNEYYSSKQTPETYLGYARAKNFNQPEIFKDKIVDYHFSDSLPMHNWVLGGKWIIHKDKIVAASSGATVKLHFYAGKVYAVLGVLKKPIKISLSMNGKLITDAKRKDINSRVKVDRNQLYPLIKLNQESENILELTALNPGLEIYTFTFGS